MVFDVNVMNVDGNKTKTKTKKNENILIISTAACLNLATK